MRSATPQLPAPASPDLEPMALAGQLGSAASRRLRLAERDDGQALVEYSLILMLVALLAIGALTSIGGSVTSFLTDIATDI